MLALGGLATADTPLSSSMRARLSERWGSDVGKSRPIIGFDRRVGGKESIRALEGFKPLHPKGAKEGRVKAPVR